VNEPTPPEGSALPSPTFFDPAFERLPAAASFHAEREGPVLLVFDRAADRDWVADAAIAIATGWNAAGRRTVLADLSLDDPMLAERIGMSALEGVVDVFLYGASLARSARAVPGRGFYLISAGTYTPDAAAILRHPRWEKLGAGFRETGASLLLFVPADAPGLATLARHVKDAIVLAERSHAEDVELGIPDFVQLHAWLTPPEGAGVGGYTHPGGSPFPEPEPATGFRPWEAPPGSLQQPHGEEFRSAEATVGAPSATLPAPSPEWEAAPAPVKQKRGIPPILLALLAIAVLAGGLYALTLYRPGLFRRGEARAEAPTGPAQPRQPAAAPTVAGVELPYAVFVKAYPDYEVARREAEAQARQFPDARFYVTYENTNGVPYFKVFSGTFGDTVEARAHRSRLLEAGVISAEDVGTESDLLLVRPYTLELGEYATQEAAEARVDSLARGRVPAYAVPVPFSDGTERWKVFGGAFEDSTAAQPMVQMLQQAQVPARLVRRTGRAPAAPK
jgi:hypothetical protein